MTESLEHAVASACNYPALLLSLSHVPYAAVSLTSRCMLPKHRLDNQTQQHRPLWMSKRAYSRCHSLKWIITVTMRVAALHCLERLALQYTAERRTSTCRSFWQGTCSLICLCHQNLFIHLAAEKWFGTAWGLVSIRSVSLWYRFVIETISQNFCQHEISTFRQSYSYFSDRVMHQVWHLSFEIETHY